MDAAGKDSAIRQVMSGVNPQGCQVFSFKQPSTEELEHDFLWRTTCRLPERGRIGIFNRSYYGEVLIARVHPEILAGLSLPPELADEDTVWNARYRSIVDHEAHLHRSGTRIIRIFLRQSKDEQRRRFRARIEEPDKTGTSVWPTSRRENCGNPTCRRMKPAWGPRGATAPWHVIPADEKKNARLTISQIILDVFNGLKMAYPAPGAKRRQELKSIRKLLAR
jgi:polyphosphate kinase 2 (PPK2 family)